jgi:hypothetical protein
LEVMTMPRPEKTSSGPEGDVLYEEYLLRRAARSRIEAERQTVEAVSTAVADGVSWRRIGQLLEMPAPLAQRLYEPMIRRAAGA